MTTMESTSPPPPPLDDPSATSPLSCPELRWGILACGRVSNDFTIAITRHIPTAKIVACASRSNLQSAQTFASKHNIPKAYGSYNDLLNDEQVQAVYVGCVHSFRREVVEACLVAKKHVLVEKPFACSVDDAKYLISLARKHDVFCMEGLWTCFFPAITLARRLVLEDKIIGEVVSVYSDFSIDATDNEGERYPNSFMYNHDAGGGSTYIMGPYPLLFGTMFFGGRAPDKVVAVGQVDDLTGVDLQASVALSFGPLLGSYDARRCPALDDANPKENTPKLPGAGVANLHYGLLGESPEETIVVGTKGRLKVCSPSHCPTKIVLELKSKGRSAKGERIEYEFPLPKISEDVQKQRGEDTRIYNYPGSAGFAYEAAAVARCIKSGRKEAPQYSLTETLVGVQLIEKILGQLGVKPIVAHRN